MRLVLIMYLITLGLVALMIASISNAVMGDEVIYCENLTTGEVIVIRSDRHCPPGTYEL
jgi:hypothetical protein